MLREDSTTIYLPSGTEVKLEVLSILGSRIALLSKGFQPAGTHNFVFDDTELSSGLYFYRLEAGGHLFTKKMILLH